MTLPTLTPAIRTGELGRMFEAEVNTASTSYLSTHGRLFVNAYSDAIASTTIMISPIT